MNVYLVQTTSFGDSKLNGVYETRKLAEEACETLNAELENDVDMLLVTEMKLNETNLTKTQSLLWFNGRLKRNSVDSVDMFNLVK